MAIPFKKFVVIEAIGIAAFNAGINALYTWHLWRSHDPLTLFGENAVAFDLASTPVWIAVLSTLLGTAFIRQKLRDGRVVAPQMGAPLILGMLPSSIVLRALVLGAVGAVILSSPIWLMLQASTIDAISVAAAVLMKVAITVPLSLVIVPLVIHSALADVQRTRHVAAASHQRVAS